MSNVRSFLFGLNMRHQHVSPSILLASLVAFTSVAHGQSGSPSCKLEQPPKQAKRIATHGVDLLVYPPTVPPAYTGCQITWLEDGQKLSTAYFNKGEAQWLEVQEPDRAAYRCHYKGGVLVKEGAHSNCPTSLP